MTIQRGSPALTQGNQVSQTGSNVSNVSSEQKSSGWGILSKLAMSVINFVVEDDEEGNVENTELFPGVVELPPGNSTAGTPSSNLANLAQQVEGAAAGSETFDYNPSENAKKSSGGSDLGSGSSLVAVPTGGTDESNLEIENLLGEVPTASSLVAVPEASTNGSDFESNGEDLNFLSSVAAKNQKALENASSIPVIAESSGAELAPIVESKSNQSQPGRIKIPETLLVKPSQQSETESKQEAVVEVVVESDEQKLENLRNGLIATLEQIKITPLNFGNLNLTQLEKVHHAAQWVLQGIQGIAVFAPLAPPLPPPNTQGLNRADQRKQEEEDNKLTRQKTLEKLKTASNANRQMVISQGTLNEVILKKTGNSPHGSPEPANSSEKISETNLPTPGSVNLKPVTPRTLEGSEGVTNQPASPSIVELPPESVNNLKNMFEKPPGKQDKRKTPKRNHRASGTHIPRKGSPKNQYSQKNK